MSNIVPQPAFRVGLPDTFSRTEGKALSRQQNAEVTPALVAGTRVQAAGFVAGVGLQTTAMLSREARFQADSPGCFYICRPVGTGCAGARVRNGWRVV
jgi:hypothetical protein